MEVDGDGWVGAWWVGFLVCGLVALILSVLVVLLPPALPGLENPPADQVSCINFYFFRSLKNYILL